jgi:thiol-disulfide isomerase/thioredoxin
MHGGAFPEIKWIDENFKTYELPKDKIVVLDFWTSSCSVCFKKFPQMNTLYNKFKNNNQIVILAVNVPLGTETFEERKDIFNDENLDFKSIYAVSMKDVQNQLQFNTYPNIVILNNNKIVYNGYIEPTSNLLSYNYLNVEDEINKLLK